MFDRPFELSFEEGHRQTKLKKDKLDKIGDKHFYSERYNQQVHEQMSQNSILVDFERGSTFGGVLTTVVFVGFIYLILNDLSDNINNKPYTFDVKDKYMSPKELRSTVINLDENEKSTDFMLGITVFHENGTADQTFDPLNNDYFDVIPAYWDSERALREGLPYLSLIPGPKFRYCGKEKELQMFGPGLA